MFKYIVSIKLLERAAGQVYLYDALEIKFS